MIWNCNYVRAGCLNVRVPMHGYLLHVATTIIGDWLHLITNSITKLKKPILQPYWLTSPTKLGREGEKRERFGVGWSQSGTRFFV